MEFVGGFMVMMTILGLFLTVVWIVIPFVVFSVKGQVDRSLALLESIEQRLTALEGRLGAEAPVPGPAVVPAPQPDSPSSEPPPPVSGE